MTLIAKVQETFQAVIQASYPSETAKVSLDNISHLEMRVPDADHAPGLALYTKGESMDEAARLAPILAAVTSSVPNLKVAVKALPNAAIAPAGDIEPYNEPCQRFELTDGVWTWSPVSGFLQIHGEMNQRLLETVRDAVRGLAPDARDKTVVDLFSGSGNFGLMLAAQGYRVLAYERDPVAVIAANRAAQAQGLPFLSASADLRSALEVPTDSSHHRHGARRLDLTGDVIVINPPRAGLGTGHTRLAESVRKGIVLCGCHPVPLARDVRTFLDLGFRLQAIHLLDMFPQTHHFETVAILERASPV